MSFNNMWGNAKAAWAAANIGFSAFLYLLDFATTLSTLRTYYLYQFECPHAPLDSSLLRDPLCQALRYGTPSNPFPAFWFSLVTLLLAHLIYGFLFWLSLDPSQHPLRLAYFLPLIHLYRLLKLFYQTLRCNDLKELTKSQQETNSLFNVIGACVETIPQFCLQFVVAMQFGEHVQGSSDPNLQTQKLPTNLIVSLVVSLLSGSYITSVVVWSLIRKRMSLARRAFYCFLIGCQTMAAMVARAMLSAALSQFSKTWFSISLLIYITIEVIIAWRFVYSLLRDHQYNGQDKTKYSRVAHSLGLAVMTRLVGPTYIIVKFSKRPCLLVWGTLSHVFIELIGTAFVILIPVYIKEQQSPCHSFRIKSNMELVEENEFLTCKVFLGSLFSSLFIFLLTTLQIFCLESSNNASSFVPCTFTETACDTHYKSTYFAIFTVKEVDHTSRVGCEEKSSHQRTTTTFFTLFLFVISILFIQKLQKKYVLKRPPLML